MDTIVKYVNVMDFPGVDITGLMDSTQGFNEALAYVYEHACDPEQISFRLPTGTFRIGKHSELLSSKHTNYSRARGYVGTCSFSPNSVVEVYLHSRPIQIPSFSTWVYTRVLKLS